MHHLLAYEEVVDNTANADTDAITDDIITIHNSHFTPQQDLQLLWATAMAATLNRARLQSPSFRQTSPPHIRPVMASATPEDQQDVADYSAQPFMIRKDEELALEVSSDVGMTEQAVGLVGVSPGLRPSPAGDIFTIRGTSVTASVALTWTTLTTTWADDLPEGRYTVVGLEVIGVTQLAGRLIFEDQTWRPGCVASVLVGNQTPAIFRKGRLGSWGQFRSRQFPQVQVLNVAAGIVVHTVYMDVVRIA